MNKQQQKELYSKLLQCEEQRREKSKCNCEFPSPFIFLKDNNIITDYDFVDGDFIEKWLTKMDLTKLSFSRYIGVSSGHLANWITGARNSNSGKSLVYWSLRALLSNFDLLEQVKSQNKIPGRPKKAC